MPTQVVLWRGSPANFSNDVYKPNSLLLNSHHNGAQGYAIFLASVEGVKSIAEQLQAEMTWDDELWWQPWRLHTWCHKNSWEFSFLNCMMLLSFILRIGKGITELKHETCLFFWMSRLNLLESCQWKWNCHDCMTDQWTVQFLPHSFNVFAHFQEIQKIKFPIVQSKNNSYWQPLQTKIMQLFAHAHPHCSI